MNNTLPGGYEIREEIKQQQGTQYWKYTVHDSPAGVIGSVVVMPKKYGLTINDLQIDEQHRRKGLAKILLETIIDKHGKNDLFVRPRPYNDKPVSKEILTELYERYNFVQFGGEGRMVRLTSSYYD